MIAALATATGVDRLARNIPHEAETATRLAVRFVEAPLFAWTYDGAAVFLTATDAIAVATGLIVLVRFWVWALAPLFTFAFRRSRNGNAPGQ